MPVHPTRHRGDVEVVVPEAVVAEVGAKGDDDPVACKIVAGESAVLALAFG